ncbi:MAG TPA: hypothetical protein GXZ47_08435 [Treponema sp.]|nr:hypothetical protein [Treponema sp.]
MFENLLAQPAATLLINDIKTKKLPQSILFSGEGASGKLTAALELARTLSCLEGTALWACSCSSCQKHRQLIHPDLLLAGPKDCLPEIRSAAAAFLRNGQSASRFLFIRSIRKLILRFDPVLYQGDEARYSKAFASLSNLGEDMEDFERMSYQETDRDKLEKKVASLVSEAEKLETTAMYETIPVSMIRKISTWTHLAPYGKKKTVIIERADRMQDSARNAFLKILEEPPKDVVFILTTSRRGAILPTILSRVRTYGFIRRSLDIQHSVITRVFHDTPQEGETLSHYFNRFLPVSPEHITSSAVNFLSLVFSDAVLEGKEPPTSLKSILPETEYDDSISSLVKGLNKCKPDVIWRNFLVALNECLRSSLRSDSVSTRDIKIFTLWTDRIRELFALVDIYNLTPVAALERLSVEMRNAL